MEKRKSIKLQYGTSFVYNRIIHIELNILIDNEHN